MDKINLEKMTLYDRIKEKSNSYFKAPSGGPLVQHGLPAMLELVHQGEITVEKVIDLMCHRVAELFEIKDRGYIREGYKADLVLVNPDANWTVTGENILYKCVLLGERNNH